MSEQGNVGNRATQLAYLRARNKFWPDVRLHLFTHVWHIFEPIQRTLTPVSPIMKTFETVTRTMIARADFTTMNEVQVWQSKFSILDKWQLDDAWETLFALWVIRAVLADQQHRDGKCILELFQETAFLSGEPIAESTARKWLDTLDQLYTTRKSIEMLRQDYLSHGVDSEANILREIRKIELTVALPDVQPEKSRFSLDIREQWDGTDWPVFRRGVLRQVNRKLELYRAHVLGSRTRSKRGLPSLDKHARWTVLWQQGKTLREIAEAENYKGEWSGIHEAIHKFAEKAALTLRTPR